MPGHAAPSVLCANVSSHWWAGYGHNAISILPDQQHATGPNKHSNQHLTFLSCQHTTVCQIAFVSPCPVTSRDGIAVLTFTRVTRLCWIRDDVYVTTVDDVMPPAFVGQVNEIRVEIQYTGGSVDITQPATSSTEDGALCLCIFWS